MERPVVLLVAEDETIRAAVRACLASRYEVVEAQSADEAARTVEGGHVDLVLLDAVPSVDPGSPPLARRLKGAVRPAFLPVLVMAASTSVEERDAALRAGADDYTDRPPQPCEVEHRLQHLIERRRQDTIIRGIEQDTQAAASLHQDWVGLLVHDLRNPLSGLLLTLDCADTLDAEGVVASRTAAGRIRDQLDDITEARGLEESRSAQRRVRVPLANVLREALAACEPHAEARGVRLAVQVAPGATISAEPRLLKRAVENILYHSLRQSSRGSTVQVTASVAAEGLDLEITDDGPALHDEAVGRIFEKYGAVLERRVGRRSWQGMGLYLPRLIAEAHGGTASYAARGPRGNRYTLRWPDA